MKVYKSLLLLCLTTYIAVGQSFKSPSEMTRYKIVVNMGDLTIKTSVLNSNKKIRPKSGHIYLWYTSNKILETEEGFDGRIVDGQFKVFYINDQLKEQGTVKNGLRAGRWIYWYSNGRVNEKIRWKKGQKWGEYKLFNNDGELIASGHFKKNRLHGRFVTYDKFGRKIEIKKYRYGCEQKKKKRKTKRIKNNQKQKDNNTTISSTIS